MSFMDRETESLELIEATLDGVETVAVGFSGGKDSTAILDLVRRVRPKAIPVFCNTGVEARETLHYCNTISQLVEVHPAQGVNFWNVCEKNGYPCIKGHGTNRVNACCDELKDKPMKKWIKDNKPDLLVDGLTMAESHQRAMFLSSYGPFHYVQTWNVAKLHPIAPWKPYEVYEYIWSRKLPYNEKYNKGSARVGCITCTAFIGWEKVMLREYPTLYKVMAKKMKLPTVQQRLI